MVSRSHFSLSNSRLMIIRLCVIGGGVVVLSTHPRGTQTLLLFLLLVVEDVCCIENPKKRLRGLVKGSRIQKCNPVFICWHLGISLYLFISKNSQNYNTGEVQRFVSAIKEDRWFSLFSRDRGRIFTWNYEQRSRSGGCLNFTFENRIKSAFNRVYRGFKTSRIKF